MQSVRVEIAAGRWNRPATESEPEVDMKVICMPDGSAEPSARIPHSSEAVRRWPTKESGTWRSTR
ncbi:hypothetical protein GCM10023259_103190 [Thermocatellispora tengchongensis]